MPKNSFYITTPIYYVNDKPHIGHAYTTILADVLARYQRLLNVPTWFLTGTDEHGQKVERAAAQEQISPQEQADRTVVRFQELWQKLEITNDDFIRTTEERHTAVVRELLQMLYDKGEIYRDEYDGWYCVPCERFYTEKDLQEGNCPECGRLVEKIREANYFFKMSQYQEWLIDYIQTHPEFIQPDSRRNETLGFLRQPLNDLCISRPKQRVRWGIELPFDTDYVTYVWFDALVNYISAIGHLRDDATFDRWWPASLHLIGKDILTTHTVYWPTMLKAMGLQLPQTIFAHGWWLVDERKMSKTDGNAVNPMELVDRYGVDAFRYYLIAEMSLGQDASFSEESFVTRYNADLANDLGNLSSRILKMIRTHCDGMIPEPAPELEGGEEAALWVTLQEAVTEIKSSIKDLRLDKGLARVWVAVRAVNRYLEQKQPWHLAKQEEKAPLRHTLYTGAEALRVISGLLYPVMPEKMTTLRAAFGIDGAVLQYDTIQEQGRLASGMKIQEGEILFPRIKTDPSPKQESKVSEENESVGVITYDDFIKTELKTGKVLEAEKIEGADKLLRLSVMLGEERRQIVAGIALYYTPEELIGKTVVVVTNLKPAKIRGVESNGMVLAASKGESLKLVTLDGELSSGATVR